MVIPSRFLINGTPSQIIEVITNENWLTDTHVPGFTQIGKRINHGEGEAILPVTLDTQPTELPIFILVDPIRHEITYWFQPQE